MLRGYGEFSASSYSRVKESRFRDCGRCRRSRLQNPNKSSALSGRYVTTTVDRRRNYHSPPPRPFLSSIVICTCAKRSRLRSLARPRVSSPFHPPLRAPPGRRQGSRYVSETERIIIVDARSSIFNWSTGYRPRSTKKLCDLHWENYYFSSDITNSKVREINCGNARIDRNLSQSNSIRLDSLRT